MQESYRETPFQNTEYFIEKLHFSTFESNIPFKQVLKST